MLAGYVKIVSDILQEGVDSGEFAPVEVEPLVWAILATYDGLAAYAEFVPDLDVQRVSNVFIGTLLGGLRRGGEQS
jgi:hypothetical protein